MQPAVFLDRDNTLIVNDGDLGDPARVKLREGVPEGLRSLRSAGYRLIVVTNQAGVARGVYTEADVDAVHQRIAELVDQEAQQRGLIDRFYYCPYHPEATVSEYQRDHPWRKPHPGMLLQAARDLTVDLGHSWLIGDQQRDIAAGRAAGCRTVLLNGDEAIAREAGPTARAATFAAAVDVILRSQSRSPMASTANGHRESGAQAHQAAPHGSAPAPHKVEPSEIPMLRRAVAELSEELRASRLRRTEFTVVRMAAVLSQLLVLLLALLGLLQLATPAVFMSWMVGAVLVQLLTIALLVLDLRA